MAVPGRRCVPAPCLDNGLLKLAAGDSLQRTLRPELTLNPTERVRVGAPARASEIGLSRERVDSVNEQRKLLTRRAQPATGSLRPTHRREYVFFTGRGGGDNADERSRSPR
jgi:hypothetical protein